MARESIFLPPTAATSWSRGRELAALAYRQHGAAARAQLLSLGYSRHEIQHLLDIAFLHPVWPGVYAVGHRRLSRKGRYMAGVLASGAAALLCDLSAGVAHGITRSRSGLVHVATPSWRKSRPGLRLHTVEDLDRYATSVDGIPVMSVARTLLSLAASLRLDALARAVEESERLRLFDLRAVDEVLAANPRSRGSRGLRQVLADYRDIPAWTRSGLEVEFLRLVSAGGLPMPAVNVWVAGHEVDCVWFDEKVAVELDGGDYHSTTAARARDPRRDIDLQLAGYVVVRVSDRRVALDPIGVIGDVRRALQR